MAGGLSHSQVTISLRTITTPCVSREFSDERPLRRVKRMRLADKFMLNRISHFAL